MMNVFAAALGALTDAVEGVCDPLNEPAQSVPMVHSREEADDPVTLFRSIHNINDEGELLDWKQNAETDFVESDAMLVAVANLTSRSHYIAVAQFLTAPHHQAPLTALSYPAQQSQARQRFHNAAMYDRLLDIFLTLNGSHRCTVRKAGGNLLQEEEGTSSGTISDEVVAALRFLHPAAAWDALPSVATVNRSNTTKKGGGSVAPLSLLLPLAKSALQYPKGLPLEALASVSPSAQKHRAETVAALLYSSGPRLAGATVHSATAACCVTPLLSSLPTTTTTTTESIVLAEHEQRVLELSTCAPLSTLLSQCQWDVLWQRLRQSGPTASTKHSRIPPLERVHFREGGGDMLIAPGLYLLLVKSEDQNVVGSVFVAHSSTTAVSGETNSQANNTGTTSAPPPPWALLFTFTPTLHGIAGISSHSDDAQLQYASRVQLTRDDERHTKRISLAVKVGVRSQYIELHALELRIGASSAQCRLVNQIRRYAQPAAESLTTATSENRNSFQPAAVAAAASASFHFSVPTIDDVFVVDRWELFRFPDDCSTPHTTGAELSANVRPERSANELPLRPTFLDGTLAVPLPAPVAPPNERATSEEHSDDEYDEARNLTHQADSLPQHKTAAMPGSDFGSWEDLAFALDAESNADGPYLTTVDADTHASLYVARAPLRQNTPPSLFEHPPKLAASLAGPARRKGSSTRSNGSSSNGSGFVVV